MNFIPLSRQYRNDWDRIALDSDDAWFFHLYDWLSLSEETWGVEPKSFLLEYQGKFIGIFPLQLNKRSRSLKSTCRGLGGAALVNHLDPGIREKALKMMHEHAREIARAHQSPFLEVFLSPLTPSLSKHRDVNPLVRHFYEDISTHTLVVDLTQPEDKIIARYSENARKNIKKAREKGYTVAPVTDVASMEKYYEARLETARRNNIDPHPKDFFLKMYELFCEKKYAIVWEAKDAQGEAVAFEVTVMFNRGAYYWMGCCRSAHLDAGVNYLLQHHAIISAKRQGAQWFESGEAFPNAEEGKLRGLTVFKGKFGGELHRLFKGRVNFSDQSAQPGVFKNWVRANIRLLTPVLKDEGVKKIETGLSALYKCFRKKT